MYYICHIARRRNHMTIKENSKFKGAFVKKQVRSFCSPGLLRTSANSLDGWQRGIFIFPSEHMAHHSLYLNFGLTYGERES